MKFKIRYEAWFEVEVECEPEDVQDAAVNIPIPESEDGGSYISDTFNVLDIKSEDGEVVYQDIVSTKT